MLKNLLTTYDYKSPGFNRSNLFYGGFQIRRDAWRNVPLTQRNPMKKNDEATKKRVCLGLLIHPLLPIFVKEM